MSVQMALPEASHHTAPRGQRIARAREEEREVHNTAAFRTTVPPPEPELFDLFEEPGGGAAQLAVGAAGAAGGGTAAHRGAHCRRGAHGPGPRPSCAAGCWSAGGGVAAPRFPHPRAGHRSAEDLAG